MLTVGPPLSWWCVLGSVMEVDDDVEDSRSSCLSLLSTAGDMASGNPDLPLPPVWEPG